MFGYIFKCYFLEVIVAVVIVESLALISRPCWACCYVQGNLNKSNDTCELCIN